MFSLPSLTDIQRIVNKIHKHELFDTAMLEKLVYFSFPNWCFQINNNKSFHLKRFLVRDVSSSLTFVVILKRNYMRLLQAMTPHKILAHIIYIATSFEVPEILYNHWETIPIEDLFFQTFPVQL